MARTSMTVDASYTYQWYDTGNYDSITKRYQYKQVAEDRVLFGTGTTSLGLYKFGMLAVPPDLKATLGHRVIYDMDVKVKIRALSAEAPIFVTSTNKQITNYSPGTDYIEGAPYSVVSPCYLYYENEAVMPAEADVLITTKQPASGVEQVTGKETSDMASKILRNRGLLYYPISPSKSVFCYQTLTNGHKPQFIIYYDDTEIAKSRVTVKTGPKSGYYNPREAINITLKYMLNNETEQYSCLNDEFDAGSTTLYWKESEDETYNSISLGSAESYTVPANTFPVGKQINWYLSGQDSYGRSSTCDVMTFSTAAAPIVSTPISPINTVEDVGAPITFEWSLSSADNFPVTRVVLEWRDEGDNAWHTICDVNESITEYTAPADELQPVGNKEWRAVGYNVDGTAGVPEIAAFVAVGAPLAPVVFTDSKPFLTLTWQAGGQQSYEIEVGGRTYGPYFGTEKTFTIPDYLEDGEYTARVRVMGVFGLWSSWGEEDFTVANMYPTLFDLRSAVNVDASLYWQSGEENDYIVYRDDKQIGHTNSDEYDDRVVLGTHEYFVVNRLQSGYYRKSKTITKTESVDFLHVALLSGGEWVKIEHTLKKDPSFAYTKSVSYNHMTGHVYPVADCFDFNDIDVDYTAVFLFNEEEERKLFTSMFGKPVILKTPDDSVVIGIMEGWQREARKHYYTSYTFTIHRIDWSDYVDVS